MKKQRKREVGQRLKQVRERLRLTQSRMALDLIVARSTYSTTEAGTYYPAAPLLLALGEIKGVSIDWLLFGRGGMFNRGKDLNEEVFRFVDGNNEAQDLLYLMKTFPLFNKRIMEQLHQFKQENQELAEEALKKKNSG
ncbi:MAG: helix-turn-helix transcriptional regulator [bacterium]|nr:helix-turn-helix transcriptional regulator [bacterium]